MPTLLTDIPNVQPPLIPHRKRWTREQCAPLEAAGVFEREKLELVDGDLISKMGKNRPYVNCFRLMQYWLLDVFGRQFVDAEAPIDVDAADNALNEPQPDLIVLNRECGAFTAGNPKPQDIRLLIEISDSTLNYDLNVKGPLYARAGLVEYWVVDISARRLVVHRNPDAGRYASVVSYSEPEPVAPLAAPGAFFCVSEALLA